MHSSATLSATAQPQASDDAQACTKALYEAFADRTRTSGFLPLAEEAVRAHPGDGEILHLAATAALLDGRGDRALTFLKRFAKRFHPGPAYHLLQALALGQQKKPAAARALLEAHGGPWGLAYYFPAGAARRKWFTEQIEAIMAGATPARRARPAPRAQPAKRACKLPPAATAVAPLPGLPRLEIDIPMAIEIDLAPLAAAAAGPHETDGRWYDLRQSHAHLGLAQGFDELLCLPHLRGIDTLWYQIETVRKVLKHFRGRVLLADEVGLGKTIEAGMVLKEYLLRGMVERFLVLVPASLVGQWREELESKFDICCATTQDGLLRQDPDRFWDQPRVVASLATARRREHAGRLRRRDFDLVIVDEAHHLRDRASESYKLVDGLNKRFLLLLSATPVQNDLTELYNVLTLLKPGVFKTLKDFRTLYMTAGKPRQPANSEQLRGLMRSAMIRNTRAVVALRLPRRHAATMQVEPQPGEAEAYAALAGRARQLAAKDAGPRRKLALHHLLAAAGSSPAAAAAAIARFAARHDDDAKWRELARRWTEIASGGKEAALFDLLHRNPAEKKLVFVRYRETLDHLADLLARRGIAFARFDGGLSGVEKDAAIAAFRERVPVLLSSESGGEGRNLQFCNTMINFDVPWNPMAIEQRIGRIDRIGQQREVFVFNLVTRGTIEEQVLRLLDEKISMFELVVGEVGAILGSIEDDRDFADLVLDAWLETTEETRREAFDAIGRRLEEARRQHEDAKALDEALFGEAFEAG
jgi:superfamily II DNA or RNA helicase